MTVNIMSPVAISGDLQPELKRHHGSILHNGSIRTDLTKPSITAYATRKEALAGLTRAMAEELGDTVRMNAIKPAAIATPMLEAGYAENPDLKTQLETLHPTGAISIPADVALKVLYLHDPANSLFNEMKAEAICL